MPHHLGPQLLTDLANATTRPSGYELFRCWWLWPDAGDRHAVDGDQPHATGLAVLGAGQIAPLVCRAAEPGGAVA